MSRSAAEKTTSLVWIRRGQCQCHYVQIISWYVLTYSHEICTHNMHITFSMCRVICMFNAESEKQQREKDRGSLWGRTGRRDGGVMKKWLKERCWEGGKEERQMVWGRKGRRASKTRNRQWSRWIGFAGRWLGGIKKTWQVYAANGNCLGDITVSGSSKIVWGSLIAWYCAIKELVLMWYATG